eukprot:COSAG02_NODE_3438_length_6743_cov_12.416616_1_plen_1024_part_10
MALHSHAYLLTRASWLVAGIIYSWPSTAALRVNCTGDTVTTASTDGMILVSSVVSDVSNAPPCAEPAADNCVELSDMTCYTEAAVPDDVDIMQHRIYAMGAEQGGDGEVVSMADENELFLNDVHVATLSKGQRWTGVVNDFDEFAALGPIYGSTRTPANGEHVMASGRLKGRTFSFGNFRCNPLGLWARALHADASCSVRANAVQFEETVSILAGTGHVFTINNAHAGSGSVPLVVVVCDEDIVLATGQMNYPEDYMVVPPESTEWYGVVSTRACLSQSGQDQLEVTESCSDGTTRTITLPAGGTHGTLISGYEGQYAGKACRYNAAARFNVHSLADGDGNDAVNLLPTNTGSTVFGASTRFDWLAFASLEVGICRCSHGDIYVNECANGVCKGRLKKTTAAGATCDCTVPMFGVLECADTDDEQLFYGDLVYEAQPGEESYTQVGLGLCFHRSASTMTWNECSSTCESQGQDMLTGESYEHNSLVKAANIARVEGIWLGSSPVALLQWNQRLLIGDNGLGPILSQSNATSPQQCGAICSGVEGATGFQYGKDQESGQCICGFGNLSDTTADSNWDVYGFEAECCCQSPHVDSFNVTAENLFGQPLASAVLTSQTSLVIVDGAAYPTFQFNLSVGLGPLAGISYLESQIMQFKFSDGFTTVSCDAPLVVGAPRMQLSQDKITVSALITGVETTQVTLTNTGTEDLVLRTGAPNGMSFLDPDGNSTAWALATAVFGTRTMQVAAVDDIQIVLSPNAVLLLLIECQGTAVAAEGTYQSELTIFSNDPATPSMTVPLEFTVNDYGLIMIGLPQSIVASVAPASVTEHSQTVYNVLSDSLQWGIEAASGGCQCNGQGPYPCSLSQYENIGVEVERCNGTIPQGGSFRVHIRLTAPQQAGNYQESWRLEPTSGLSQSFLRASVDMTVTPALNDFLPSATSITIFSAAGFEIVRATATFRLECMMYDTYGNEIRNDGLSGWSVVVNNGVLPPIAVLIEFDFTVQTEGRRGVYATRPITAQQQGVYNVSEL